MRCKNCGWENPEGIESCEKCHSSLNGVKRNNQSTEPTYDRMRSTVSEKVPFGEEDHISSPRSCPRCGYPVSESSENCPNCNFELDMRPVSPSRIQRVSMGTVMGGPIIGGGSSHRFCTLRPIAWEGEDVNYNPMTFTGESIVLNRGNTDPNNNSITSREQAILSCEDGEWYIENRSELRSTFIRVNGKVKLRNGDIIVLGNREFEFKG